jgi:hypothetical protein
MERGRVYGDGQHLYGIDERGHHRDSELQLDF